MRKFLASVVAGLVLILGGTMALAVAAPAQAAAGEDIKHNTGYGSISYLNFKTLHPRAVSFEILEPSSVGIAVVNASNGQFSYTAPTTAPKVSPPATDSVKVRATYGNGDTIDFVVRITIKHRAAVQTKAEPATSITGTPVTLTTQVTSMSSSLSGQVTFLVNRIAIGTAEVSEAGVASLTTSSLPIGTYMVEVTYTNSDDFIDLTQFESPRVSVTAIPSVTALNVDPSRVPFGGTADLIATVTPSTASGTVNFASGNTLLGSATVADGVAVLRSKQFNIGNHPITATYLGDGTHSKSVSSVETLTVDPVATETKLVASSASSTFGDSTTFTATVSPAAATGSVVFMRGGDVIGTATLSSGTAVFSATKLPAGNHAVTAKYTGDAQHALSTSPAVAVQVAKAESTTGVSLIMSGQGHSSHTNLQARVLPLGATGLVTFKNHGSNIGVANVSNGYATLVTTGLPAGQHLISAEYAGDDNHRASSATTLSYSLAPLSTTTTVSPPASTPTFGDSIDISATVAPIDAIGHVTFTRGGITLGTAPITDGTAILSGQRFTAGSHDVIATYSGDDYYAGSASLGVPFVVAQAATETSVGVSQSTTTPEDAIDIAASVTATNSSGDPVEVHGTVEFFANGASLGSAPLVGGAASLTNQRFTLGDHVITARFNGSNDHTYSSSQTTVVTVAKLPTSLSLTTSESSVTAASPLTLTATVDAAGATNVTGSVDFTAAGSSIGTGKVTNGVATLEVSSLPVGASTITASYSGDGRYLSSSSQAETVEVTPIVSEFTLSTSPQDPHADDPLTITARATAGTPTGTISFRVKGDSLADISSNANLLTQHRFAGNFLAGSPVNEGAITQTQPLVDGSATIQVPPLPAGKYSVSASYGGDAQHSPVTLSTTTLTVAEATLPPTPPTKPETPKPSTSAKQPGLAATGAESPVLGAGAALILIAAGLILFTRRREADRC